MIAIRNLHAGYGAIEVLHGIDLDVEEGRIATVIGANGAGKTTLLMTICGRVRANQGEILIRGEDVTRLATFELVKRGIAHVPEGRRIFARMSVLENLQMGGTLSGGEQQMLAIARALMMRPRALLLDEPSLGLAPMLVRQVFEIIANINRERRTTILLIEQNAFQALRLADQAYVMVNGRITKRGGGVELLRDADVQNAYLGVGLGSGARGAIPP